MVTQSGKNLPTASPDRTSCMFGVPGMKTKNNNKNNNNFKRRTKSWEEDIINDDDDDQEPMGMSGALSSSRNGGGGGGSSPTGKKAKKDEGCSEWRRKEKGNRGNKKSKGTGIAAAYVKDVGKKGVKKRKVADQSNGGFDVPLTKEEKKRRKERMMRFQDTEAASPEPPSALDAVYSALSASRGDSSISSSGKKKKKRKGIMVDASADIDQGNSFVGTSQKLEKPYLRLTTFPKAEDVRPLPVLKRALEHIKARFHTEEDFEWANEQLKSVRQDLTVQGLRNKFVLEVYETHARLSLEEGELNEFNQCQTKLKEFTLGAGDSSSGVDDVDLTPSKKKKKSRGSQRVKLLKQDEDVADEFAGYRLLYALVQKNWADVTKELACAAAMTNAEDRRVEEEKERDDRMSSCRHAMLVTKAVVHCDYHDFFILYENAPHMSCYLMDFLVKRIRCGAYERIISAFRPTISVEYFRETLRFRDLEETRQFLKTSGATFVKENGGDPPFYVDCKESKNLC